MSASTVADVGMLVWCVGLVSLGQSRFGGLSSFGPSTDAGASPTDLSVECLGGLASRLGR